MSKQFLDEAQALQDMMVEIRRDLHQHPELGYQEVRTSGIVAEKLAELGYEVQTGVGKTGVVGLIGGNEDNGRTVLMRFDMDALPILEENDVPYRSQNPGVMHACGHDGHVAMGLGVANILARYRDKLPGTIKLMFQPAEEGGRGAMAMIKDGLLEGPKPDVALSIHLMSSLPLGKAVVRTGAMMAAADTLHVIVRGKGGHAAHPETTVDAVVVASHLVVALQSVVSRSIDADKAAVVTVGSIKAGEAGNVIADSAELRGSIRTFDPDIRETVHRRIREVAAGVAATFGAEIEANILVGVEATVNADGPTEMVQEIARGVLGAENVDTKYRTMGSEDFGDVLKLVPGNYFFIGARNEERGFTYPHHNPRFDFDEACMPLGVAIMCESALKALNEKVEEN